MNSKEIENGTKQIYRADSRLAAIIDAAGECKLVQGKDYYTALLRSIVGQQLSTFAAKVIIERFFLFFNNKPAPELILQASVDELRSLGLSYAKIKYVKDLSEKIIAGEVHFRNLHTKSDEQIIADLTKVKGIGIWTVHMFLIFTLSRLNVLPTNDLGIRKAVKNLYGLRKYPDEKRLKQISRKNGWEPYNTIASWYLWKSIDMKLIK